VPGGTGANAAVAAARILGPGEVALFAALGRDGIADTQLGILATEGVEQDSVVRIPGQSSGHAYIFVDHSGQNVIASSLGANAALNARHATQARLHTLLQQCHCIVLTDPPLPVASHLLRANGGDIPALWDPGIAARHGWTALAPLMSYVDSLFLNEAEAGWLFGATDPGDILRAVDRRSAPSHLVLKLGARGSLLVDMHGGGMTALPPLPIAELGLEVVSAVGCGDVFIGTCAACLALGHDLCESLLMASAAAGLNATRPETRGGPTLAMLLDTIQQARRFGFTLEPGERNAS